MARIIRLKTIFLMIGCVISLEIYNDNPKNGIIYVQNQQINVKEFDEYLYYTFDVSTIQYMMTWIKNSRLNCTSKNYNVIFNIKNITWNVLKREPELPNNSIKRIRMNLLYSNVLNNNLDLLNGSINLSNECQTLTQMANTFNKLNFELNKLAKLDISSLDEIISLNDIAIELSRMVKEFNGEFRLSFSLAYELAKEIFKYVDFKFYQEDYLITLSFKIPFYKKLTMFNVFKKPVVLDSKQYFLKNIGEYAIFEGGIPSFISEKEFSQDCFYTIGNIFCGGHNINSHCENEVANSANLPLECLEKMDNTNVLTKIDTDLYFTIFEPIIINVACNSGKYSIKLDYHAKIVNSMECSLNASNFHYDTNSSTFSTYDMFFLKNSDSVWEINQLDLFDFLFIIGGIVLSNITTVFYYCRKLKKTQEKFKDIDLQSECASSIHVYETVDYE